MESAMAALAMSGMGRRNTLSKEASKGAMTSCLAENEQREC